MELQGRLRNLAGVFLFAGLMATALALSPTIASADSGDDSCVLLVPAGAPDQGGPQLPPPLPPQETELDDDCAPPPEMECGFVGPPEPTADGSGQVESGDGIDPPMPPAPPPGDPTDPDGETDPPPPGEDPPPPEDCYPPPPICVVPPPPLPTGAPDQSGPESPPAPQGVELNEDCAPPSDWCGTVESDGTDPPPPPPPGDPTDPEVVIDPPPPPPGEDPPPPEDCYPPPPIQCEVVEDPPGLEVPPGTEVEMSTLDDPADSADGTEETTGDEPPDAIYVCAFLPPVAMEDFSKDSACRSARAAVEHRKHQLVSARRHRRQVRHGSAEQRTAAQLKVGRAQAKLKRARARAHKSC